MSRRRDRVAVQPDYARWREVTLGMTYPQVVGILGDPEDIAGRKPQSGRGYYLCYGWLEIPSAPDPRSYEFLIGFDKIGIVWLKCDPFEGVLSENGVPSKPRILIPLTDSNFHHYPRIIDVRWSPSSGIYPMAYHIQFEFSNSTGEFRLDRDFEDVHDTYIAVQISGDGVTRARVRGHNSVGFGEWSDYRTFVFRT